MANSKRHRGKKCGPKEEQGGHNRPTRFEDHPEFRSSWDNLAGSVRGRLAAKLQEFKRDWLKADITEADLSKKWDYKPLKGAARKLKVTQIDLLRDYRIALKVVTKGTPCVWLLRVFLKSGRKNKKDIDRATAAAEGIGEEAG